jgi:signal peptidase II
MSVSRNRTLGFALAGIVFAADQWLKWLMMGPLQLPARGTIELASIFRLAWTQNSGISLGLFTAGSEFERWALVAMTGAVALVVCVWLLRERKFADIVPLGLVLGGALGNIVDRVRFGFVVDYANLHFGEWSPFLVINLADAAITLGVLIILARSFLSREKRPDPDQAPGPTTPAPER